MAKSKQIAEGPDVAPPMTDAAPGAEPPARRGGPVSAAPSQGALPPPNGVPTGARAAALLANERGPGAPGRARTMAAMQRSVGAARVNRLIGRAPAPGSGAPAETAGLVVSHPESPAEREAAAVADEVTAGRSAAPIATMPSSAATPAPRPEDERVHAASTGAPPASAGTATAAEAIDGKGAGHPLSPATRGLLESRMGADLGRARLHTDSQANEAAGALNARAFTHGSDIFMARGESENDTHLMAHEAAHVVQQGATGARGAARTVSRETATTAPAPPATVPPQPSGPAPGDGTTGEVAPGVVELQGQPTFNPTGDTAAFLETRKEATVNVRFGTMAQGAITVRKTPGGYSTLRPRRIPLTHPLLARVGEVSQALMPSLIVRLQDGKVGGYLGLAAGDRIPDHDALVTQLQRAPTLLGLVGFSLPSPKVTNAIEGGILRLAIVAAPIKLGGAFVGAVTLSAKNEQVTFEGNAVVSVTGLANGTLDLKRAPDGAITGKATVALNLPKGFSGTIDVAWDGQVIAGEGKVGYTGEKLSGDVTLRVMEREQAAQLEQARKAPPPVTEGGAAQAAGKGEAGGGGAAPARRADGQAVHYVVFGEGDLAFAFTEWLNGTAHVIVDPKGFVTIIGKITPQKEFELFEQKDYVKQIFKVEARAAYGVPVVGNIFIFANVGMDAFAKLGPAKFYNIVVEGTYSTDPEKNKDFSIRGSLNISAAAGVRLRGEGGAGLEVLGHDIKAGAGVNGIAGIRGYAEATPIVGYREKGAPGEDKKGEFFIRGELEITGQPFLGLSGDLFVELDSPWWSPAPDKKWTWPLGEKEYPIGGSLGVLASVDYVFGSQQLPSIEFKPVDFNAEKFMTDLYTDKTKPKSGEGGDQKGDWKEKNSPDAAPPAGTEAKGDARPGKTGEPPTAKPTVQPGGLAGPKKDVDPTARTAEGKSVKELQDEAARKGKRPEGATGAGTAGAEQPKAKDAAQQDHDAKLKEGLAALGAVTAAYAKRGATREELQTGVNSVRRKFQVFKSIGIVDGGTTWNYHYVASSGDLAGPLKAAPGADLDGSSPEKAYLIRWHKPEARNYPPIVIHTAPDQAPKSTGPTAQTDVTVQLPSEAIENRLIQLKVVLSNLERTLEQGEDLRQKYDTTALKEAQETLAMAEEDLARIRELSAAEKRGKVGAQAKVVKQLKEEVRMIDSALTRISRIPELEAQMAAVTAERDALTQEVAGGGSGARETRTIGVDRTNQVDNEGTVKRVKSERLGKEREFKSFLARAGHDLDEHGDAPDHVRELAFGGPDDFNNLWPLARAKNFVPDQQIDLESGKQVGVGFEGAGTKGQSVNLGKFIGKWFRIKGFRSG